MISLPAGILPDVRTLTDDEVLVAGLRAVSWQWELLDRDEVLVCELAGVVPGGTAEWNALASIKASGQITITDVGQGIDWLNARLRPVGTIAGYSREIPVGVWLPVAPTARITDLGRVWDVALMDKLTILDADVWRHPASGSPATFTATAGSDVIGLVRDLITDAGESAAAIQSGGPSLARDMVWEGGTTRLKIINDLLDAAGYFSLWTDHSGQYRATPYTRPQNRPPLYAATGPFTRGPTSIMDPAMSLEKDIASVPNLYFCTSQGDLDSPALTSTAVNIDPASPFSTVSRGRVIAVAESGVEAVDQATLDLITRRKLDQATAVTSKLELSHLWLPDLLINSTIRVQDGRGDIDMLCTVQKTSVTFGPLGVCTSTLQEVAGV